MQSVKVEFAPNGNSSDCMRPVDSVLVLARRLYCLAFMDRLKNRHSGLSNPTTLRECVEGTVQSVDDQGRENAVLLPTGREVFDVPPDCPAYLRGERSNLRIAQARDEVRVILERGREGPAVKLLET